MNNNTKRPTHHVRKDICATRAPYREGRKPTAVKVYTINQESKYILIQGVPDIGVSRELVKLFDAQGDIEEHQVLENYPRESFQEVHLIKYKKTQSARFAKRKLDDWSFYGGVLHVCYAPEYETVQDTREKLRERKRVIEARTRQYKNDGTYDLYQNAKTGEPQEPANEAFNPPQSTSNIPQTALQNSSSTSMHNHYVALQTGSEAEQTMASPLQAGQLADTHYTTAHSWPNNSAANQTAHSTDIVPQSRSQFMDQYEPDDGNVTQSWSKTIAQSALGHRAKDDSTPHQQVRPPEPYNGPAETQHRLPAAPVTQIAQGQLRPPSPSHHFSQSTRFTVPPPSMDQPFSRPPPPLTHGNPGQSRFQEPSVTQNSHTQSRPQIQLMGQSQALRGQQSDLRGQKRQAPANVVAAVEQARAMQQYQYNTVGSSDVGLEIETESSNSQQPSSAEHLHSNTHTPLETTSTSDSDIHMSRTAQSVSRNDNVLSIDSNIQHQNDERSNNTNTRPLSVYDTMKRNSLSLNKAGVTSDKQLILPPPPKQRKTAFNIKNSSYKLDHARVPSAQATFPVGFDARTNVPQPPNVEQEDITVDDRVNMVQPGSVSKFNTDTDLSENQLSRVSLQSERDRIPQSQNSSAPKHLPNGKTLTKTAKIQSGSGASQPTKMPTTSIKGAVPKFTSTFIPRQAMAKIKSDTVGNKKKHTKDTTEVDVVNKELRKNAFKLGKKQGPVGAEGKSKIDPAQVSAELSVNKSMKQIRKHLKDLT